MRIGDITDPLGSGGDGSIYTTHYWLCRSSWRCGWSGIVADVQSSDLRDDVTEISRFGSRSDVPVPSVASQSACPRGPGNQDGTLRSSIASIRGETNWDDSSGVLGPNVILDSSRFGGETPNLPGLFQSTSGAFGFGRTT